MPTTSSALVPVVAPVAPADVVGTVHWVDGELVVRMRPSRVPDVTCPPGAVQVRPSAATPVPVPALRPGYRWTPGDVSAVGALAVLTTVLVTVSVAMNHLVVIVGTVLGVLVLAALAVTVLTTGGRCPGRHCGGCRG